MRWIMAGVVAAAVLGGAVATLRQQAIWRDSWAIWKHTLKYYPDTARHQPGPAHTCVPPDDAQAEPLLRRPS
jgi:hypothetical protein